MVEGELILEKKLAPKGTVPGLTALLSANMRAMTVKVDEASGVAGFVAPENRVDVLVTVDKGEYNQGPVIPGPAAKSAGFGHRPTDRKPPRG